MSIAIFGAAGEIGSRLTLHLLEKGVDVKIFTRASISPVLGRYCLKPIAIPTNEISQLSKELRGCSVVINCAIDKKNFSTTRDLIKRNVELVRNILKASEQADVNKVIHLSSIVVLPPKITPTVINNPYEYSKENDWYTMTKIATEKIIHNYHGKLKCIILRPAIVYGPGLSWSIVAFSRIKRSSIILPANNGYCYAIHVDDLCQLIHYLTENKTNQLIYGINPELVTWFDFYSFHASSIGLKAHLQQQSVPTIESLVRIPPTPSLIKRNIQWLIQNPFLSLLPKITILKIIGKRVTQWSTPHINDKINDVEMIPYYPPLYPSPLELEMYQSNGVFSDDQIGCGFSFGYHKNLNDGTKHAGCWWNFKLQELMPNELTMLNAHFKRK